LSKGLRASRNESARVTRAFSWRAGTEDLTRNSPLAEIFHSYLGSNIPTMNSMHGLAVNWILAECPENFTALKFRKDVAENFKSRYT
jgi:hypothetical protein